MLRKVVSQLLVLAGFALVIGCSGGDSKPQPSPNPEDDSIEKVELVTRSPDVALVKVSTVGAVGGSRPAEIRRCEQTAEGQLRMTIELWDKKKRTLQARTAAGWRPARSEVHVSVVVSKVSLLKEGDQLKGVMIEDRLWQVVAATTVPLTKQDRDK
jgi:hypothetical protein